jgi:arylsulfatase A-like enzyme
VDLDGALRSAGVASDVVVAGNGASALIYAKNHDAVVIQKTAEKLQATVGVDVVFTAASKPEAGAARCGTGELGWVPGTFSLELVGQCNPARGADVIVTFRWTSEKNAFGFPGIQSIATANQKTGVPGRSGHGGLNPWMVHTPMLFWGPDFRRATTIEAPVANIDIAPTILALEEIKPALSMRGRVIGEVFAKHRTKEPARKLRTVRASAGPYCAEIVVSTAGDHPYVDQGQRCPN